MNLTSLTRPAALLGAAALPFGPAPAIANAARLGGGDALEISLGRIVAALLVCLVIAGLAIFALRQRGGAKVDLTRLFARWELRPRAIHVVEARRLSPHADICLVRHGDREYLLLLMAGNARVLNEGGAEADAQAESRE